MKLIAEFFDLSEADRVSSRMRSAGVMTVVTSKRSYNLSSVKTGALKVGLWAVFEDQHDDALQLLNNHNHKPKKAISLKDMDEIQELARTETNNRLKRLLEKSAAWFFGSLLLALVTYITIGIINDT